MYYKTETELAMDENFVITPLRSLDEAYVLWKESGIWTDEPDSPREKAYGEYFLAHNERFLSVYDENQKLAAVAILFFDGRKASIYRLAVKEKYRRMGISKLLVSKAEKEAVLLGAGTIYVLVRKNESRSINLFSGRGYSAQSDAVYYTKTIG